MSDTAADHTPGTVSHLCALARDVAPDCAPTVRELGPGRAQLHVHGLDAAALADLRARVRRSTPAHIEIAVVSMRDPRDTEVSACFGCAFARRFAAERMGDPVACTEPGCGAVWIVPRGYARDITLDIGFAAPAAADPARGPASPAR
jgi:hypothetical protein